MARRRLQQSWWYKMVHSLGNALIKVTKMILSSPITSYCFGTSVLCLNTHQLWIMCKCEYFINYLIYGIVYIIRQIYIWIFYGSGSFYSNLTYPFFSICVFVIHDRYFLKHNICNVLQKICTHLLHACHMLTWSHIFIMNQVFILLTKCSFHTMSGMFILQPAFVSCANCMTISSKLSLVQQAPLLTLRPPKIWLPYCRYFEIISYKNCLYLVSYFTEMFSQEAN